MDENEIKNVYEIYKKEFEIEMTYLKSTKMNLTSKMTIRKSTKIYLKLIMNLKMKTYLKSQKKKLYLKATNGSGGIKCT